MTPPLRSVWIAVTLSVGAVSVIFPQNGAAFPRGPYFTRIDGPDTAIAGEETSYTCSADCTPPCNYLWSADGQTLKGEVLRITPNGLTSSFEFSCTSINPESGENSTSWTKKVQVKNPVSVQPAAGKEPSLNQNFTLTCSGSAQKSTITWLKDGNDLTIDAQMSLSTDNSTLSFTSLLPSHDGLYRCVSYKSNNRIVSVGYLLSYVSLSVSISGPDTAEVGKEHTFECKPDCNISCDIYWTFRRGFPSGSYSQQRTVIKWTPNKADITQDFTCVVENNLAKKSAEVTKRVKVVQKPNKKVKPESGSMALKPSTALCLMFCLGLFLHSNF